MHGIIHLLGPSDLLKAESQTEEISIQLQEGKYAYGVKLLK